jgi:iron-sulfur cluster repair protein YtfE (RIC family)
MSTMQPLRDEHSELLPHIEEIRHVADVVGAAPSDVLREQIAGVCGFLREHLIPHAKAEEAVLYPEVERAMAAPRATAAMSRDHMEVVAMTDELQELERRLHDADMSNALQTNARRLLYGLYALVKLHFTEEEEIYVPVLEEALNADQANEMFERMEAAAAAARGRA